MVRLLPAASAAIVLLACSVCGAKVEVPSLTEWEASSAYVTQISDSVPVDVEGALSHRFGLESRAFLDPKVEPEVPMPKLRGIKTMILGFVVFACMLILVKAYHDASPYSRLGEWSERASVFLFNLDLTINPHVPIVEDVSTEHWIEASAVAVFASGAATFVNSLFQRWMARRGIRPEGAQLRGLGAIFSVLAILFFIWALDDYVPYIGFLLNICTGMLIGGVLLLGASAIQALQPFSALMRLLRPYAAEHPFKNQFVEKDSFEKTQKTSCEQPQTSDKE